jgi:hypothetical protein
MLIVLPSTPTTEEASAWLARSGVEHCVITLPERLDYKTAADNAIYVSGEQHADVPMQLTRERFIVMRVFKGFQLMPSDHILFSNLSSETSLTTLAEEG